MTGYTVHTGSTEKFADGWDRIFGGKSGGKQQSGGKAKTTAKATEKEAPSKKSAGQKKSQ